MRIDFNINELSEAGQRLLLVRSNQWGCTPAQALARILEEESKREVARAKREAAKREEVAA